jgi:hypothetical protein
MARDFAFFSLTKRQEDKLKDILQGKVRNLCTTIHLELRLKTSGRSKELYLQFLESFSNTS